MSPIVHGPIQHPQTEGRLVGTLRLYFLHFECPFFTMFDLRRPLFCRRPLALCLVCLMVNPALAEGSDAHNLVCTPHLLRIKHRHRILIYLTPSNINWSSFKAITTCFQKHFTLLCVNLQYNFLRKVFS